MKRIDPALAQRITELREARGMSVNELAAAIGVTPAQVRHYEHAINEPSLERQRRIALALGVPFEHLRRPPGSSFRLLQRQRRRRSRRSLRVWHLVGWSPEKHHRIAEHISMSNDALSSDYRPFAAAREYIKTANLPLYVDLFAGFVRKDEAC